MRRAASFSRATVWEAMFLRGQRALEVTEVTGSRGSSGSRPQQLLHQLHQREALLAGGLVDAGVDEVFVQHGAAALQRGGVGLLLVHLLLLLRLLLGLDVLRGMNAGVRADSKPPSAIRLLTSRSIMKRRPGLTLISWPDAAGTSNSPWTSEDSALARSSAVGSSTDQPLCSTACAAACTELRTPALLARTTAVCLRLASSAPPGPRPSSSGSTWLLMAACSWGAATGVSASAA
ncbi:hypothetical protein EYF80_065176 [Liparis tanakae]|uniref:Uncharacterized protein n=1 Tax=Liparis tanakae TaxID=230148 RepID=A0A4Z2E7A5_9TELE|nr:hypothetical protein EYF80_065176 [Liparis tanakae]